MHQAMPSKRKPLTNILEWDELKSRLIPEYGNLHEFGRSVKNQFLHLLQFLTKREVAEILAPRIKELISVIECVGIYHNISTVQNIILNTTLNQAIVRCLPSEFNIMYLEKLADHISQDPMNQEPVSIFYFNAKFVTKIELGFKANPVDFDHALPPINVNVNAVHYGNPHPTNPTPSQSYYAPHHPCSKPNSRTIRPCCLCTYKEFDSIHYTLSEQCGVRKLNSTEIIRIIDATRTCPSCGCLHSISQQCRTVFPNGRSKICTKGSKHNGYCL